MYYLVQRERGESTLTHIYMTLHDLNYMYFNCFPFQLLSEIEEHLKCTITQCEPDIKVPVDEFDGKVTYGQRRTAGGECISQVSCLCASFYSLLFISVSISSHTPQVVSIRAMWIYWPLPYRNWPIWSERHKLPSFNSAIYPTNFLKPSRTHLHAPN